MKSFPCTLSSFCDPEPSPQIENKFRPQQEDKVHGNDFIYTSFGPNAGRRHRHFKALFTCQDPDIDPPNRSLYLNLRVRPMLMWLKLFLPLVWLLGLAFSVDDMIMGFNFKHKDKLRIMYTNEGGGFQRIHFVRKSTHTKYTLGMIHHLQNTLIKGYLRCIH